MAVVLYLSIYGIRNFSNHQNTPQHISHDVQQKIVAVESDLKSRIDGLISQVDTNVKNGILPGISDKRDPDHDGDFYLFVFRNDSLVYWNNNEVIIPVNFKEKFTKANFVCQLKNGWYGFTSEKKGSYRFLGCYLIKTAFPFQNEFIKNQFSSRFHLPASVSITDKFGLCPVYSRDGTYLFDLSFENYHPQRKAFPGLVFLLFILGSLCLIYFLIRVFTSLDQRIKGKGNLLIFSCCSTIILLRIIQSISGFPAEIYQSELFGPAGYSSSSFLPSLGDFSLDMMILLVISLVIYRRKPTIRGLAPAGFYVPFARNTFLLFILLVLFQGTGFLVSDLVLNSAFSPDLQNISALTYESIFGFFILTAMFFSWWLVSTRVFEYILQATTPRKWLVLSVLVVAGIYTLICWFAGWNPNFRISVFFMVYLVSYWYLRGRSVSVFSVQNLLYFFCFYAIFTTYLLNRSNQTKETEKLNLLAIKLVTKRNPVTEVLFEQVERRLHADSLLNQWINPDFRGKRPTQDSLIGYLQSKYFKDYWKKYQVQITCCDETKELRIQPQGYLVSCDSYFRGIIHNYGEATLLPNLFFLDYGSAREYYLAVFSRKTFISNSAVQPAIFM